MLFALHYTTLHSFPLWCSLVEQNSGTVNTHKTDKTIANVIHILILQVAVSNKTATRTWSNQIASKPYIYPSYPSNWWEGTKLDAMQKLRLHKHFSFHCQVDYNHRKNLLDYTASAYKHHFRSHEVTSNLVGAKNGEIIKSCLRMKFMFFVFSILFYLNACTKWLIGAMLPFRDDTWALTCFEKKGLVVAHYMADSSESYTTTASFYERR